MRPFHLSRNIQTFGSAITKISPKIFLLFCTLSVTTNTFSQLWVETFDEDGVGVIGNCTMNDPVSCATSNLVSMNGQWSVINEDDYSGMTAADDYFITSGGAMEARDVDGEVCLQTEVINLGSKPVIFSIDFGIGQ